MSHRNANAVAFSNEHYEEWLLQEKARIESRTSLFNGSSERIAYLQRELSERLKTNSPQGNLEWVHARILDEMALHKWLLHEVLSIDDAANACRSNLARVKYLEGELVWRKNRGSPDEIILWIERLIAIHSVSLCSI